MSNMVLWVVTHVLSIICMAISKPVTISMAGDILVNQSWNYVSLVFKTPMRADFETTTLTTTKAIATIIPPPKISDALIDLLKSFNFGNLSNIEQRAKLQKFFPETTLKILPSSRKRKVKILHHKLLRHGRVQHIVNSTSTDIVPPIEFTSVHDEDIELLDKSSSTTTTTPTASSYIPSASSIQFSKNKHTRSRRRAKKKKKKHTTTTTMTTPTEIPKVLRQLLEKLGVSPTPKVSTTTKQYQTHSTLDDKLERVTMYYYLQPAREDSEILYEKAHFVRNNTKIKDFTLQIFKQHLNVFAKIKSRLNNSAIRHKIDQAARSYSDKFAEFVNETQHRKIVTKLGTQKVVLNTIETSNRIMNRLLTFLLRNMEEKGSLRYIENVGTQLRNEIDNEEQQQYVYACQMFNICRAKNTFSSFLADFLTILLQTNDMKLKQGADAITEVLKDTDLHRILDHRLRIEFMRNIEFLERINADQLRPMIWMFRNMLTQRNQPIVLQPGYNQIVLNKSVALLDLVDILDEKIPSTEENMLELNDMRNSMVQWANSQRTDITEIMQVFIKFISKKAISRMNSNMAESFHDNLNILLKERIDDGVDKEVSLTDIN